MCASMQIHYYLCQSTVKYDVVWSGFEGKMRSAVLTAGPDLDLESWLYTNAARLCS